MNIHFCRDQFLEEVLPFDPILPRKIQTTEKTTPSSTKLKIMKNDLHLVSVIVRVATDQAEKNFLFFPDFLLKFS